MQTISGNDLLDIAVGGTVLGTGGGGSLSTAEAVLHGPLKGKTVQLIPISEVPRDQGIIPIAGMGSPEAMLKTPLTSEAQNAFRTVTRVSKLTFSAVMPLETSGFNFLAPMTVAAASGLAVVDADGAGRAIPRLNQTLFYAHGISMTPLALANAEGDSVLIHASRYEIAEKLAIATLEAYGWFCGLACYPMKGTQARVACIEGTISLAKRVGQSIRMAKKSGEDPVGAVLEITGGTQAIHGRVGSIQAETKGSYSFGIVDVQGSGSFEGHSVRVKSMNENMALWKDGKLLTFAPDRICYLSPDGLPVTNADLEEGDHVTVFTIPAQSRWKRKAARGLFQETLQAMGLSNQSPQG